jgi:hypothetical protein
LFCLPVSLSPFCLSGFLCLFIPASVSQPAPLSRSLSLFLFLSLSLSIYLSLYLSIYLSIYLYLSIYIICLYLYLSGLYRASLQRLQRAPEVAPQLPLPSPPPPPRPRLVTRSHLRPPPLPPPRAPGPLATWQLRARAFSCQRIAAEWQTQSQRAPSSRSLDASRGGSTRSPLILSLMA